MCGRMLWEMGTPELSAEGDGGTRMLETLNFLIKG